MFKEQKCNGFQAMMLEIVVVKKKKWKLLSSSPLNTSIQKILRATTKKREKLSK